MKLKLKVRLIYLAKDTLEDLLIGMKIYCIFRKKLVDD